MRSLPTVVVLFTSLVVAASAFAIEEVQVTNPTLEEELAGPYSYYRASTDQLGFKDCPEGTMMTFDGAFMTSFGELDLFAGPELKPVNVRVRTLYKDYLPIFEYTLVEDGVRYGVQSFSAPYELNPRNDLITFVRITMTNPGAAKATAKLKAAFVEKHGLMRHELPCAWWYRDLYMDAQSFEQDKTPKVADSAAWWDEHLVLMYSADGLTSTGGNEASATYAFELAPGESGVVKLKMPYVPIHKDNESVLKAVASMDFDAYAARTVEFYETLLAAGTQIDLPDPKVVSTVKAGLLYMLTSRDITEDGRFEQHVNEIQYDSFYFRDSTYMVRVYDMMGQPRIARETLDRYIIRDDDARPERLDGHAWVTDDWGQSLWALGAHFRTTGDVKFATFVYPAIPAHVQWFLERIKGDPDHLWPATGPYDNEVIHGHYTGHSFWALLGLREAINLAQAVGADEDAARFQKLHDEYRARFMKRLASITATTEGYIPPGIDHPLDGKDWANASAGVYPFGVLEPFDPMVTATVETVRGYKYREGIMTYGPNAWTMKTAERAGRTIAPGGLHHYETFYVTETLLARGEQEAVVQDLYSVLAHTSSTHAGFEWAIWPYATRYVVGNYSPHSWCAARTIELVRNMLVREHGRTLHLASALAPQWLKPGTTMGITNAPTNFGPVSFKITPRARSARIVIDAKWRTAPDELLFHVPWYIEVTGAKAGGRELKVADGPGGSGRVIALPVNVRTVDLTWRWTEQPQYSFERAARTLLENYHNPSDDMDREFLFPRPRQPELLTADTQFDASIEVRLTTKDKVGRIVYTLDGTRPDSSATPYTKPFTLTESAVVKAVTVWPDGKTSGVREFAFRKLEPHEPVEVHGLKPGLRYSYFEQAATSCSAVAGLEPMRAGVIDTFTLDGIDHREDDFIVEYTGHIAVPAGGIYTFYTASDDGSMLYIADELVVDNDRLHPVEERQGRIKLKKGAYPIRVVFFEKGDVEKLTASYQGPGIPKQLIPASVLFHTE